ncbi:MAG: DUF1674 domain-containing protein [Methylococcales bacterium]|nr:DUF1674 domain-containing protein [Methylococcales bacterium]
MASNLTHEPAVIDEPVFPQDDNTQLPDDTPIELGGPKGPEPTRFGDWEKNGRCIDF